MVFGPSKPVCPQVVWGLASGVVLRNERNDKHNVQSTSNNRKFHMNNASCNNWNKYSYCNKCNNNSTEHYNSNS